MLSMMWHSYCLDPRLFATALAMASAVIRRQTNSHSQIITLPMNTLSMVVGGTAQDWMPVLVCDGSITKYRVQSSGRQPISS